MCCALMVVGERAVHIPNLYIPALQVVGDELIVIISFTAAYYCLRLALLLEENNKLIMITQIGENAAYY